MKYCDITIAYNDRSGGIRTYIDEKRRYLRQHTDHEHLLIVPGERDAVERQGQSTTIRIASPLLPRQDTYRFFLRPGRVRDVLLQHRPDVVELGCYYVSAWGAFGYRRRLQDAGRTCLIGCYLHTDVAEAYVAAPLSAIARDWFDPWSRSLASLGEKLADVAATRAEGYMRAVLERCDVTMVASSALAARLRGRGIERVRVVPLGVDLDAFHPRHRSDALRARHGATKDTLVLVYAGRLCTEKRVMTLVEATEHLSAERDVVLWIAGDGPLRDSLRATADARPSIRLLPYQKDRRALARLLASADVYVTAGPHETFALSVVEAQACGLPVVGVGAGALPERVSEGLGFLGPTDDVVAMSGNVARAAAARSTIGLRARRRVEQQFSWTETFRELLEYYETTLSTMPGRLPSGRRESPVAGALRTP